MLAFEGCDMGNGCENIGRMSRGPLNAVPVVNATLSCFGINVEVLQVVVEIHRTGAKISTEEGSMCGEDGSYVHLTLFGQRESDAG